MFEIFFHTSCGIRFINDPSIVFRIDPDVSKVASWPWVSTVRLTQADARFTRGPVKFNWTGIPRSSTVALTWISPVGQAGDVVGAIVVLDVVAASVVSVEVASLWKFF